MGKSMAERLCFDGGDVFLDGKKIFTIPVKHATMDTVTVMGFYEPEKDDVFPSIHVGSGTCCHGHLYKLVKYDKEPYILDQVISINTNVMDVLPVDTRSGKDELPGYNSVLVVGVGCAGAGVRLVDTYYPRLADMMSSEEFHAQYPNGKHAMPVFRVDAGKGSINVDFRRAGWREKPGMRRDPALPAILADPRTEEFRVSYDLWSSVDLTRRLQEAKVDVAETLKSLERYRRVFSH